MVETFKGEIKIDLDGLESQTRHIPDNITEIRVCGVEMLLGKILDEIRFNKIPSPFFKPLVLGRIENPVSKLTTTDYWSKHHNIEVGVVNIYRYLDKLHDDERETIQRISFEHTQEVLGGIN